jgi:predicted SAM-dependent methyltransferase
MTEIKINFGCGGNILEGWTNVDAEVDITKPLPYADNTVDFILAEHICEHVTGPQFLRFLDECHRILKSTGTLRICMPVIVGNSTELCYEHARDLVLNHGHQAAYMPRLIHQFILLAGFRACEESPKKEIDGHWRAIGQMKDRMETYRCEAVK